MRVLARLAGAAPVAAILFGLAIGSFVIAGSTRDRSAPTDFPGAMSGSDH